MSMIEATKNIYNKPCFGTFTRVNHLHKCGQLTLWVVWVRYILYSAAKGQLLILRHLEQFFVQYYHIWQQRAVVLGCTV